MSKNGKLNIIGISALYHDSACCLLQDGIITAAAQEERFTKIKFDPSMPVNAFMYCLEEAGEYLQRALDTSIFNLVNDPACISVIGWPAHVDYRDNNRPKQPGESKLEALKRCMYPLYGEIHTFTAAPGNVRETHDVK